MPFFSRLRQAVPDADPLYAALVGWARDPWFYTVAGVPDSMDGRYDMLSLMLALALNRLDAGRHDAFGQALVERFVSDMDESLREMGAGDMGVGRRVRIMAEGFKGRFGAYQRALEDGTLEAALLRNVYRGQRNEAGVLSGKVQSLVSALAGMADEAIIAGRIGPLP